MHGETLPLKSLGDDSHLHGVELGQEEVVLPFDTQAVQFEREHRRLRLGIHIIYKPKLHSN